MKSTPGCRALLAYSRRGERSNGRNAQLCLTVIVVVVSDLDRSGGDLDLAGEAPDARSVVLLPAIVYFDPQQEIPRNTERNSHNTLPPDSLCLLEAQPARTLTLYANAPLETASTDPAFVRSTLQHSQHLPLFCCKRLPRTRQKESWTLQGEKLESNRTPAQGSKSEVCVGSGEQVCPEGPCPRLDAMDVSDDLIREAEEVGHVFPPTMSCFNFLIPQLFHTRQLTILPLHFFGWPFPQAAYAQERLWEDEHEDELELLRELEDDGASVGHPHVACDTNQLLPIPPPKHLHNPHTHNPQYTDQERGGERSPQD